MSDMLGATKASVTVDNITATLYEHGEVRLYRKGRELAAFAIGRWSAADQATLYSEEVGLPDDLSDDLLDDLDAALVEATTPTSPER